MKGKQQGFLYYRGTPTNNKDVAILSSDYCEGQIEGCFYNFNDFKPYIEPEKYKEMGQNDDPYTRIAELETKIKEQQAVIDFLSEKLGLK